MMKEPQMPRKRRDKLAKHKEKARSWARWKWEFLRRNSEYISDFKSASTSRFFRTAKWCEKFKNDLIEGDEEDSKLAAKYRLPSSHMIDPNLSYEQLLEGEKESGSPNFYLKTMPWSVEVTGPFGHTDLNGEAKIRIEIDYASVWRAEEKRDSWRQETVTLGP
jgi:hypothetical protein